MNYALLSGVGSCVLPPEALCPCKGKSERSDLWGAVSPGKVANGVITTWFSFFLYSFSSMAVERRKKNEGKEKRCDGKSEVINVNFST